MRSSAVAAAIDAWILDSESSIHELGPKLGADAFSSEYLKVLQAGHEQVDQLAARLVAIVEGVLSGERVESASLDEYVEAMSIQYKGDATFLPSFSDSCLKDLSVNSPFRGLLVCWALGQATLALNRGDLNTAHAELTGLASRLDDSASPTLKEVTVEELDRDIVQIKGMVRDVVMKRKNEWTHPFPYPSRTSTHFYLSGIRFYWCPLIEGHWQSSKEVRQKRAIADRYCVQSSSSGLVSISERYGYLLETDSSLNDRRARAQNLLNQLPVGCLALDLDCNVPTEADRTAARYFSVWSNLVEQCTRPIVGETIGNCERALSAPKESRLEEERKTLATFSRHAAKNPMRTFYFDCGLLAMARRHNRDVTANPPIQYVTTKTSDPRDDPLGLGMDLYESVREFCGSGLQLYVEPEVQFTHAEFPSWTLVPIGSGFDGARTVWSNRSPVSSSIVHGFEAVTPHLFTEMSRKFSARSVKHVVAEHGVFEAVNFSIGNNPTPEVIGALSVIILIAGIQGFVMPAHRKGGVHRELEGMPRSAKYVHIETPDDWTLLD